MTQIIYHVFRILAFVLENVLHLWPLLLISIPLAVAIKTFNVSPKINQLFKKNIWISILIATAVGAFSPFCSCSVILVISSMLIAGVPLGPMMAFWLASPSMDPEIFFLSVTSLGWKLAIARMVATFFMSYTGGVICHLIFRNMDPSKYLKNHKKDHPKGHDVPTIPYRGPSNLAYKFQVISQEESPHGQKSMLSKKIRPLISNILESTWFILKFLMIAYVLEALIIFYLPSSWIVSFFGKGPVDSVLTASFIGLPLYTTNISALGLIGGLLDKGLSPGGSLGFLIAGATTTLPAMTAIYKLVHSKIFLVYILVTLSFAIVSGLIYNLIFY